LDTTDWTKGNYKISAVADTVLGEIDTTDNTRNDGTVRVGIPGDVNGDGYVGIDDVFFVALHFGLQLRDSGWDPNCDITNDNYVGIDDIFVAASHFGRQES
jgi:hypothetical protein